MRKFKAILFTVVNLLFGSSAAVAQSAPQVTEPDGSVVTVPMILRGPLPAVEVMVNGQGPFVFTIDTGAMGMARADSSLVERLKLPIVGRMRARDGSGRSRPVDVVRLDSLAIGGIRFSNVSAPTRDYNASPNSPKVDGILGFDLFSEYLLTLDFPGKRVRIERGRLPEPNGAEVLGYENATGTPIVEMFVGGRKLKGRIDTGNALSSFVLPESLAKTLPLASEAVVVGRARTVSSEVEIKAAQLKDSVRLGRFDFHEPRVIFPALTEDINIGSAAFREFVVTFDQKNRRLRLERHELPKETVSRVEVPEPEIYLGRFGSRTISLEGRELYLQRQGGPKLKMLPISKDLFTLEQFPDARVKFVRGSDGAVSELHVLNMAGEWEKSTKELR
jgi:predicted aspartyl protease